MAATKKLRTRLYRLVPETRLRSLRLWSGLIMFVFVVMHLANLAAALISLETAERIRPLFLFVWRHPVGTILLYGSMVVHVALVLRTLYMKRTLRMPAQEAAQIVMGLVVPLLLVEHIAGTRVFNAVTGLRDTYAFVIQALWSIQPDVGLKQVFALVAVWVHGCLGVHFWLRFRPFYAKAAPYLLVAAVLLPVLSLLAFADAGRQLAAEGAPLLPPDTDPKLIRTAVAWKTFTMTTTYWVFGILVLAVFALREVRRRFAWRDLVEIRYESGQVVRVPKGHSVLEASRVGDIPHYSVCGGKGRCSTCRVRVMEGLGGLPPIGPIERMTLKRIGAERDIRLACQLRPIHSLKVLPLLAADRERALLESAVPAKPGREQEIAVLFCDIRGFTAISDQRLPFDVVFLLNRYFSVVGQAIEKSGGRLDKFIGDGAMALFGLNTTKAEACRQALTATAAILADLKKLSGELTGEISAPLEVAIGIHVGPAIVGMMGYGGVMSVTAIGDTVNIASRLESAAKEFDASLVVSETAVRLSGLDLSGFERRAIDIRGSAEMLDVRVVPQRTAFTASPLAVAEMPVA